MKMPSFHHIYKQEFQNLGIVEQIFYNIPYNRNPVLVLCSSILLVFMMIECAEVALFFFSLEEWWYWLIQLMHHCPISTILVVSTKCFKITRQHLYMWEFCGLLHIIMLNLMLIVSTMPSKNIGGKKETKMQLKI